MFNFDKKSTLTKFVFFPTWLTPKLVVPSSSTSPCMFTFTRLDAVISLYIIPEKRTWSFDSKWAYLVDFWDTKGVEKKVLSVLADSCCHMVVYALQQYLVK